jgi:2-polyprenyl-3-methyl-5-hydroxy-6-metoxy-1,4-benzoquinol methylase
MAQDVAAPKGARLDVMPAEVEQLEAEWWEKHAWLEDEYAWVHPPDIRNTLRKHYLRKIVASIGGNGTIVDFGCGAGWLAILLAQLGANHVIGVDNSPAQIALARSKAEAAGQTHKITFFDTIDAPVLRSADAVVIHGVLHHLSGNEIDAFAALLQENIRQDTKIFLVEPVHGKLRYLPWSLPYHLLRLTAKLRRQTAEERRTRALLDGRGDGPRFPGYGVAPKEIPFEVGELERRLETRFEVTPGRPVLFFSVRVVMELLLCARTYPRVAHFCTRFGLPLYMGWERLSFRFAPKALWRGWVFCLFEAKLRTAYGQERQE